MQVSVGRLGILTSVTLSVVAQRAVQRLLQTISTANFTAQVTAVQEAYKAALQDGSADALGVALSPIDETQVCALGTVVESDLVVASLSSWCGAYNDGRECCASHACAGMMLPLCSRVPGYPGWSLTDTSATTRLDTSHS